MLARGGSNNANFHILPNEKAAMPLANSGNVRMGSYNDVAGNQWNYNITTIHNHIHGPSTSNTSQENHLPANPTIQRVSSPKGWRTAFGRFRGIAYTRKSKDIDSSVIEDGELLPVLMRFMGINTEDDVEQFVKRLCGQDSDVVDGAAIAHIDDQLELVYDLLCELYSQRSNQKGFKICLGEIFALTGYRPSNSETKIRRCSKIVLKILSWLDYMAKS
ncbi:hypothetical protein ONZ45_g12537 [Pleurotus djamor]|nr:hypothetical protein ONZ45_g12537 [Pleurotus djamor]